MKKVLKSAIKSTVFMILCLFVWGALSHDTVSARSKLKSGKFTYVDGIYDGETSFSLNKDAAVLVVLNVKLSDSDATASSKDGIRLDLSGYRYGSYDDDLDYEWDDTFKFKLGKGNTSAQFWYYPDEQLEVGDYELVVSSLTWEALDVEYTIYKYSDFATSAKIQSTATVKTDASKAVSFKSLSPKDSLLAAECKSSNSKIAEAWFDGAKDTWYISGYSKGKCNITVKLANGKTYTCKVTVTDPAPKMQYSKIYLYMGESFKGKLLYSSGKITWTSSNKKIATVDKNGKIKAKKIGTCKITAKYKGKNYSSTIKVVRQSPNFTAYLTEYNTRNNYFTVKIKNRSNKALTVYSKGAYSMDVDYKSYDRKLKLYNGKSSVTIPAGKTMNVKFKVNGSHTWPDYKSHTVRFYFSFDSKKYLGSVWDDDSAYQDSKKWYDTYWTD